MKKKQNKITFAENKKLREQKRQEFNDRLNLSELNTKRRALIRSIIIEESLREIDKERVDSLYLKKREIEAKIINCQSKI